jgi:ATP-binding cassette, subfamily B, bacterial HlyB/CyaB
MPADAGRMPPPTDSALPPAISEVTDTGLICLLILARFYDLPADGSQLRHQFAQSGQLLSDTDLLRAAKHLGLKAGVRTADWNKLGGVPLPALAKRTDGRYVVLAKLEGEKVLVQDPTEARPLILLREQFESAWTGQLLLFTKRANLRPQDLKFDFTFSADRATSIFTFTLRMGG